MADTWFPRDPQAPVPVILPSTAATLAEQQRTNDILLGLPAGIQSNGLTNTELRAQLVGVTIGGWDFSMLPGGRIPVSLPAGGSGLTDAELRATPVPVSGTISTGLSQPLTDAQLRAAAVPVSGPLTDAQLRSSDVPVSIASMPSTPVTGTFWQATQPVSVVSLPLPSGAATAALQGGGLPSALVSDRLKVDGSGVTQPVSGTVTVEQRTHKGWSTVLMMIEEYAVAATTETLVSFNVSIDAAAASSGTSYSVPAGKVLVIHSISASASTTAGNTTAAKTLVRIRVNAAGAAIVTSQLQVPLTIPGIAAANNANLPSNIVLPMGVRYGEGFGIGITIRTPNYVVTTAAPKITVNIAGYLYDA